MPRLFSFPILDFRLTPRTPRIPCPGCHPEILRRVQGFKKAQNHTPGNKAPPVWPCFLPAVKTAPVWRGSKVIRNRGHPTAQPHSTEQRRGAAGSRRGKPQGSERRYPKRPQKSIQWSHGQGPARPSPSRVGIVLCSLLYTFSRTKAHPATTLGAPLCWRERGYPLPGHGVGTTPPGE